MTADIAMRNSQGILVGCLGLCRFQAVGVFFLIAEFQRIDRNARQFYELVLALIEQEFKTVLG